MYEFGGELLGVTPQIDLYYSYNTEKLQMYFGSFPRRDLMNYPLFLLTDSLDYYGRNPGINTCRDRCYFQGGDVLFLTNLHQVSPGPQ